jgi:ketosteroid isomerase-like protein
LLKLELFSPVLAFSGQFCIEAALTVALLGIHFCMTVNKFQKQILFILLRWSPIIVVALACAPVQIASTVDVDATVAAAVSATLQNQANATATLPAVQPPAMATPTPVTVAPQPTVIVPPAAAAPDIELVRNVIQAEVNAAANRDLAMLESLYAPDAVIVDRSGTPDAVGDDNVWRGWVNIQRRYEAFFSSDVSSIVLVELSVQVNGDEAVAVHQGALLDGVYFPDNGIYTMRKVNGQWFITQLEYGNRSVDTNAPGPPVASPGAMATNTDLYLLEVGGQHRYEEPWGWDRGDPCAAWRDDNFDDTKPNYRGFNVELLLTNNSAEKIPDEWPVTFTTAGGKTVEACIYGYQGAGPPPGTSSSATFFTVVEQGDHVNTIAFILNGNIAQLCLDGTGLWWRC